LSSGPVPEKTILLAGSDVGTRNTPASAFLSTSTTAFRAAMTSAQGTSDTLGATTTIPS
jgi:hypothetical protein